MAEFLLILLVVGVFLGVFFLSVVREKRQLAQGEPKEEPQDRKAA